MSDSPDDLEGRSEDQEPDPLLVEFVAEVADRIQSGRPLDLEELARRYPERFDELRRRLPAIELMAGLATLAEGSRPRLESTGAIAARLAGTDRLGDFRLLRLLGRGGMGVVYEAEQVSLGRRVALKILPFAAALDPRQLQRFRFEAQAAGCLHHTNIVPVHAVGNEGGVPYYAMQYIEGLTLAAVIRERRRQEGLESPAEAEPGGELGATWDGLSPAGAASPAGLRTEPKGRPFVGVAAVDSSIVDRGYLSWSVDLALQAAEALAHAHERGIVHRDVKPANLLLDPEGRLWVADFGLAQMKGDGQLTLSGDLLGTLQYMSPEQALGQRTRLDGRTDVYSLGATLYELLTLQPPFAGADRASVLHRVVHDEPTPVRRLNPAVPVDLETVVSMAMAKDREARYSTARELAADLRRFLENRPVRARRPSLFNKAAKWTHRHRAVVVAATACVGLAAVSLVAVLAWSHARLVGLNQELRAEKERADQHKLTADAQRRQAERHLLAVQLSRAQRAVETGEFSLARSLLREVEHIPRPADRREFAWRAVRRTAHRVIDVGREAGRVAAWATASPDELLLASFDPARPGLDLWSSESGRHLKTLPSPGLLDPSTRPQFAADGRHVVARCGEDPSTFWIWAVDGAAAHSPLAFKSPEPHVERLTLLTTGAFLTTHRGQGAALSRVVLWQAEPGSTTLPVRRATLSDSCETVLVSPDGRSAALHEPGRLRLVAVQDGSSRWVQTLKDEPSASQRPLTLCFSQDGATLTALRGDRVLSIDVALGVCTSFRTATSGPNETLTAYLARTGTVVLVDSAAGTIRLQSTAGAAGTGSDAAARATEPRRLTVEGGGRLIKSETQATRTVVIRPEVVGSPPEIGCRRSPDGTLLAVTARVVNRFLEPVTLRDAASGMLLATCPESHAILEELSFTPEGRGLVFRFKDYARRWRLDQPDGVAGHTDEAWGVAFNSAGTRLATGSDDDADPNSIKIWDPATGRLLRAWYGKEGTVASLAFSPDGRRLASAHIVDTGNVRLWDATTGALLATFSGHTDRARSVVFSPDGAILASAASDGTVQLWDVNNERCLQTLAARETGVVQDVSFAPNGKRVAMAAQDGLYIWDVATGDLKAYHRDTHLMAAAYSPSGDVIAAADDAGWVHLYDGSTGKTRWRTRAGVGGLNALAYSPDGAILAVAGMSGAISIVDAMTGALWPGLEQSRVQINGLAFSPDGSILASTSHDGRVRLWRD